MQKKPQGWAAVECASRSLTEVEKRYPQIDRKVFAIRWACERCYKYLIGISFIIELDHQPLLPLFNNPHSRPSGENRTLAALPATILLPAEVLPRKTECSRLSFKTHASPD